MPQETPRRTRRVRKVVTTEQLRDLVVSGAKVYLPDVAVPDPDVMSRFPVEDRERILNRTQELQVTSVTYRRDDEVQCIRIDHPDHLYVTDDFIPTHNTSNIMFLKSTDDSMLDTLQKMSGTTHKVRRNSKTITKDQRKLALRGEGKQSITLQAEEVPVITFNDMAFIDKQNSIVFRAGDPPIWNRNQTCLPMSYALFGGKADKTIVHPGHTYSLPTVPTLSTAIDFDVRLNMPNFLTMLEKRMGQAVRVKHAEEIYAKAYGYTDYDISRLDPDVYSDQVMNLVGSIAWEESGKSPAELPPGEAIETMDGLYSSDDMDAFEEDEEMLEQLAEIERNNERLGRKIFAQGTISPDMLVNAGGQVLRSLDLSLIQVYQQIKGQLSHDSAHFTIIDDCLYSAGPNPVPYITTVDSGADIDALRKASQDEDAQVYTEDDEAMEELLQNSRYFVQEAFHRFLANRNSWSDLAGGAFDRTMAQVMKATEEMSLS